jgi:multiple sugar transport system ATP-binding protein
MASISVSDVTKTFAGDVVALAETSLQIQEGEFLVLVGPSGSGKTTLLRMIAGLEDVSSGEIAIDGQDVTDLPPERRDIAMVFQNYALYPNMTVEDNLGFGLRMRKVQGDEAKRRIAEVARALGLDELLQRRPNALSGGQRQRVAMGRAIVREPSAFLMDEPLSNLDAMLRVNMRAELKRLHQRLGVTTVYVTHDQVEATTLGQRVAVLRDGRLQQCDVPSRLFERPANTFVASFIGTPAMNLVEVDVANGCAHFDKQALRPPADALAAKRLILGFRPTDVHLVEGDEHDEKTFSALVETVEDLSVESIVHFNLERKVAVTDPKLEQTEEGALLAEDGGSLLTARLPGRHRIGAGDRIRLKLDDHHLYWFDIDTGDAIAASSVAT